MLHCPKWGIRLWDHDIDGAKLVRQYFLENIQNLPNFFKGHFCKFYTQLAKDTNFSQHGDWAFIQSKSMDVKKFTLCPFNYCE